MMLRPSRGTTFRKADLVVPVLGVVLLAACATTPVDGNSHRAANAPLGSLMLSGPTFGNLPLLPTGCATGEHQFFFGFDLHDEKSGVVTRLIVDPATGPIIRVFAASAPFDKNVLFRSVARNVACFISRSTPPAGASIEFSNSACHSMSTVSFPQVKASLVTRPTPVVYEQGRCLSRADSPRPPGMV